mgnify:CR=1 FL=1
MKMTLEESAGLLEQILQSSRHILFFGGAGVSVESGIPDFRSADGLFNSKWKYPPETVLSHSFFESNTADFYEFYREKMIALHAKPNPAHKRLAEWERLGKAVSVVTQNIDGLHQKAGSRTVLELHGSIHRNRCLKCARFYPPEFIRDSTGVPKCECGGVIKPEVVLYEEGLDDNVLSAALHHIRRADTLIIAGTSLTVYPAAGLIHDFRGRHLVLINRDATPMDSRADLVIHDSVGKVFSALTASPLTQED